MVLILVLLLSFWPPLPIDVTISANQINNSTVELHGTIFIIDGSSNLFVQIETDPDLVILDTTLNMGDCTVISCTIDFVPSLTTLIMTTTVTFTTYGEHFAVVMVGMQDQPIISTAVLFSTDCRVYFPILQSFS